MRKWTLLGGLVLLASLTQGNAAAASSGRGSLSVTTGGLPRGQRPMITVSATGFHHAITTTGASLEHLRAGWYVLVAKPVVISHTQGRITAGATAYPGKGTITVYVGSRARARAHIRYEAIVNPTVRLLGSPLLGVIGGPRRPAGVVLAKGLRLPRRGEILTSGPTTQLPLGLISRVTGVSRQKAWNIVSLTPVAVSDATPEFSFVGNLQLTPAATEHQLASASSRAHAARNCVSPSLLNFGAHLDSVEVRRAFLGAWPPQLELTLAVRTTEWLGVSAAAAGINCDWTLGEIGPYDEAIPVGPIVVPVYATLPVRAGLHINGTLNVGTFNVASTSVANVAAGFDSNEASLSQQGSNVWVSGSPSISGSAKLSASIGVQAGIGVAKAANVHLEADFGPELSWSSGHSCNLELDMGSLSAGVSALGRSLNTPPFTPFRTRLWSGCTTPPASTPGPTPGSPSPSSPTPAPSQPAEAPVQPSGPPLPPASYYETTGGVTHTWTDYLNAGGYEGPTIPSNTTVQIACRLTGFRVADGNTWWYRIASSPWDGSYYASADAFYNDGATSGSLLGTPFVDPSVPEC